jgi:hypothetical protein
MTAVPLWPIVLALAAVWLLPLGEALLRLTASLVVLIAPFAVPVLLLYAILRVIC